jgi:hypothetical protein
VYRLLAPGGTFLLISLGTPEVRLALLGQPQLEWDVQLLLLPKPAIYMKVSHVGCSTAVRQHCGSVACHQQAWRGSLCWAATLSPQLALLSFIGTALGYQCVHFCCSRCCILCCTMHCLS